MTLVAQTVGLRIHRIAPHPLAAKEAIAEAKLGLNSGAFQCQARTWTSLVWEIDVGLVGGSSELIQRTGF